MDPIRKKVGGLRGIIGEQRETHSAGASKNKCKRGYINGSLPERKSIRSGLRNQNIECTMEKTHATPLGTEIAVKK